MPIDFSADPAAACFPNGCCGGSGAWYEGEARAALALCCVPFAVRGPCARRHLLRHGRRPGGEPDYEQRFTALANDLDKLLKASGSDAHVYTLIGDDATRARLTDMLGKIAQRSQAGRRFRADPDRPRHLRRRRVQVQSCRARYFRRGTGRAVRPHSCQAPADRQHHQRQRRLDCRACRSRARRDRRDENRHGEKRHGVRALLGGSAARSRRPTWTRTKSISALEAFQYADRKTAAFYDIAKAPGHRACRLRGHRQRTARAAPRHRQQARDCCFPISRCCVWAPRKRLRTIRPSANCSPRKKSSSRRSTR